MFCTKLETGEGCSNPAISYQSYSLEFVLKAGGYMYNKRQPLARRLIDTYVIDLSG